MRRTLGKNRAGQGLTEYIIVVALVAIAGIGIVNIFGNQLRNQFHAIVKAMSGSGNGYRQIARRTKPERKPTRRTFPPMPARSKRGRR